MGKTSTIDAFIGRNLVKWAILVLLILRHGGLNLDLFYVIFLEELQKIKSSGFAAAMWHIHI
jgi:hypothetical protein